MRTFVSYIFVRTEWHLHHLDSSTPHRSPLFSCSFDWHVILKRCLPRPGTLDWTRLRDSSPGCVLKKDRQFGCGLFIDSRTCSHSGDCVLIRRLKRGDQGLSGRTLSGVFVLMFSDWWGVSNQDESDHVWKDFHHGEKVETWWNTFVVCTEVEHTP